MKKSFLKAFVIVVASLIVITVITSSGRNVPTERVRYYSSDTTLLKVDSITGTATLLGPGEAMVCTTSKCKSLARTSK